MAFMISRKGGKQGGFIAVRSVVWRRLVYLVIHNACACSYGKVSCLTHCQRVRTGYCMEGHRSKSLKIVNNIMINQITYRWISVCGSGDNFEEMGRARGGDGAGAGVGSGS